MRREKETQWRVVGSFLNFEQIKRGKEIRLFSDDGPLRLRLYVLERVC